MIRQRGEGRRLTIKFACDRVPKLFVPGAGAFEALFRSGALLARSAHSFESLTGGAIGVGERSFGQRERVGSRLARGFRLSMFVGKRAARAGEIGRRVGELRPLPLRFRPTFGEFGDAVLRMAKPFIPRRALGDDCGAPRGARRNPARDRLPRRAGLSEGGPLALSGFARVLEALRDIVSRPKLIERGLCGAFTFGGLVAGGAGARVGFFHR